MAFTIRGTWLEHLNAKQNNNLTMNIDQLFDWQSNKNGGVCIAFTDRGRPTGEVIRNEIVDGIDYWIENLLGLDSPMLKVFLIGGPGNGKTDALEYCVSKIAQQFDPSGAIIREIKEQSKLPQRSIIVEGFPLGAPFDRMVLVQDASIGTENQSAADAFVADYQYMMDDYTLYVCCINRGILDDALVSCQTVGLEDKYQFFKFLLVGLNSEAPMPLQTWPCNFGSKRIGIWPMEYNSLFEERGGRPSVFVQLMSKALNHEGWKELQVEYESKGINPSYCPLLIGRGDFLMDMERLKAVGQIFREYELIENKRLTFREVLALVVYLLLGLDQDYGQMDPNSIVHRYMISELGRYRDREGSVEGYVQLFKLCLMQPSFRLFNKWPNIQTMLLEKVASSLERMAISNGFKALSAFMELFRGLRFASPRNDAEKTLQDVGTLLDPALAQEASAIGQARGFDPVSIGIEIQGSVEELAKSMETNMNMSVLDKEFMKFMVRVESELELIRLENNSNSVNSLVDRLTTIGRKVVASYVKRKLGFSVGVTWCSDEIRSFREYQGVNTEEIRGLIDTVIGIKRNGMMQGHLLGTVSVNPNSTFGQPQFPSNRISISSTILYDLKISKYERDMQGFHQPYPAGSYLSLTLHQGQGPLPAFTVPFSYGLYSAILDIKAGIRMGTLSRDIVASFQRMRSFLEGQLAHGAQSDVMLEFPDGNAIKISDLN